MFRLIVMVLAVMISVSSVHARWLQRAVERALERTGERAINEAVDSTYDAGKEGVKDSVKGDAQKEPVKEPARDKPSSKPAGSSESASAAASESKDLIASEQIYNKYDFIPGDKIIFYDDFSDTDVGEFPRKWKLKGRSGPGIESRNGVEVVGYQGRRFMRSVPSSTDQGGSQGPSAADVRLNIPKDMPEKFTIEFDALLGKTDKKYHNYDYVYSVAMYNEKTRGVSAPVSIGFRKEAGIIALSGRGANSLYTETQLEKRDQKVHRISISVNGAFVKAYIDHERVINDPDAIVRPVKYIGIGMGNYGYHPAEDIMITNFRVAEGGKDIKSALDTDGKIVTHGILFDTGSDRIKPESLPTLKMILKLLQDDPSLKFSIEGHTDNQGGTAINQPLSEKRAQAVKAWLESKGLAADRLTAKGWGQDKPMDKNDTSEGRANNRRVEFVKIK